ncbi:MAG: hypothetical protein JWN29_3075 [Acidimicrobiales bacterium]|nr:hypothetical protein [Acidimicrobiales bacterium]
MTAAAVNERVPLACRARWDELVAAVPHALFHTAGYVAAMQRSSSAETYLYAVRSGGRLAICPVAERRLADTTDAYTPYGFGGFVGDGPLDAARRHWRRFADRSGYVCAYIGLNPVLDVDPCTDGARVEKDLFVLDLTLDLSTLHANLSTNRRRQLHGWAAQRSALTTDRDRLRAFFLDALPGFMDRRRAAGIYRLTPQTIDALFELESTLAVGCGVSGRLEAVSVFGFTPWSGDFLFNVSVPGGERHSVSLLWWAVEELQARGVPTLNLGGGVRAGDSLEQFKARFGARRVPLRSLREVYRPGVYRSLCRWAGVDADADGAYFPPYRAPGVERDASSPVWVGGEVRK